MTLLQLEASAHAPCSSTITGLAEPPALTAAVLADALAGAAPGAIAIRAAARTAAGTAGRPMRRALRLSDMSISSLGCVLAVLRDWCSGAGAHALHQAFLGHAQVGEYLPEDLALDRVRHGEDPALIRPGQSGPDHDVRRGFPGQAGLAGTGAGDVIDVPGRDGHAV